MSQRINAAIAAKIGKRKVSKSRLPNRSRTRFAALQAAGASADSISVESISNETQNA